MSNNKNKLRSELTNLYGGTNKFLTNAEITTIVNRSTGSNHLNLKKQAYKQAYSKYYNHVFGNVLNKMMKIVKSEMKSSPQCPTGVNSGSVVKAVERSVRKRYGTGTTQGIKIGGAVGAAAGGVVGKGVDAFVGAGKRLAQFCQGNPTHSKCNNFQSSNERPNGRPARATAGQPPARIANDNRRGAPPARSRR